MNKEMLKELQEDSTTLVNKLIGVKIICEENSARASYVLGLIKAYDEFRKAQVEMFGDAGHRNLFLSSSNIHQIVELGEEIINLSEYLLNKEK